MKLRIYSDLHNEFHRFDPPAIDEDIDMVILAGDIDIKARGVIWANEAFACPVAYISGNHEFYGGHIDQTLQKMRVAAAPHVHVLENQSLILDKIRILGTAAWTDFSSTGDRIAASWLAKESMNDFRNIRVGTGYRRLSPFDLVTRNHQAKAWLTEQLAQPFDGKTIVVTHHSPSPIVIGAKHGGHLNAAYTNDWLRLIEQTDLWVFGHTHQAVDVELAGCRVVSNPRGYPNELTGFDSTFEVEI